MQLHRYYRNCLAAIRRVGGILARAQMIRDGTDVTMTIGEHDHPYARRFLQIMHRCSGRFTQAMLPFLAPPTARLPWPGGG